MIRAVPPVNRIPDNNTVAERFRRLMTNRAMRFALVFGACFLFGICFLLTPPMQIFGGHALVQGAILRAPSGFAVEMRDGCNAINVTLLLWSAVLAFPASWK